MINYKLILDYDNLKKLEGLISDFDIKLGVEKLKDKLSNQIFKSNLYLNNLLLEDINNITDDDISQIIYNLCYKKDVSFGNPFIILESKISICGFLYRPTSSPSLEFNNKGFYYNKKVKAVGFENCDIDEDDIHGWEYKKFSSTPEERLINIKSLLNLYEFSLFNPKFYKSARSYFQSWDYTNEDFWNKMFEYFIKTENHKAIEGINFDDSKISDFNKKLAKSKLTIKKFNI